MPSREIVDAFTRLVGSDANPGGFAALILILLVSAFLAAFRTVNEKIKLVAFVFVVITAGVLMLALLWKPSPIPPQKEPKPIEPVVPVSPGVIGWAYYEVGKDGQLTKDGQLELLPPGSPLPNFIKIKKDMVFRAKSAVHLRSESPDSDADLLKPAVATLQAGQCVVTLSNADPDEGVVVKTARSGGWLIVQTRQCP
jgi:hypothetical protein